MELTVEDLKLTEEELMSMSINEITDILLKDNPDESPGFIIDNILTWFSDPFSCGSYYADYHRIVIKDQDFTLRTEDNSGCRHDSDDYFINDKYVSSATYKDFFKKPLKELIQ